MSISQYLLVFACREASLKYPINIITKKFLFNFLLVPSLLLQSVASSSLCMREFNFFAHFLCAD